MKTYQIIVAVSFMCTILPASAVMTFTDEAAFLNAAGAVSMESFESFGITYPHPGNYNSIQTPDFILSNDGSSKDLDIWSGGTGSIFPTDGSKFALWYANVPSSSVTFTFTSSIKEFGVNILDYGYPSNPESLEFFTDTGFAGKAAIGPDVRGNQQFFGIICSGMTSITFVRPTQNDAAGFDEVYYSVPEPATMLLLGLGGLVLRKRKNRLA